VSAELSRNNVVVADIASAADHLRAGDGGGNAQTARRVGGECESAPAACGRVDSTVWDWPADTPARPPPRFGSRAHNAWASRRVEARARVRASV